MPCPTLNHTTSDTELLLFSQRSGFTQIIDLPTHDCNITDLVFMSHESLLLSVDVDIPFSTSNHSSIEFQILAHTPKTLSYTTNSLPTANKLDFDKIDHAGLAAELLHMDWPSSFNFNDNIDYAWE